MQTAASMIKRASPRTLCAGRAPANMGAAGLVDFLLPRSDL